jgi:opacity protein-like surface antigen
MKAPCLLRLAALAMAALAAPLCAQEQPSRVYAGGMAGRSHWYPGCADSGNCDNRGNTLHVFGGYQINRMFAAEVAFTNLGIIENSTSRLKAHAWEAVGVAAWPADAKWSFYGKFGLFYGKAEGSGALIATHETSNGPTAGVGVQFELSRNVELRGEAQHYWNIVDGATVPASSSITTMTVGALWRFR